MESGSNFISLPDSNQYDGVSGRSVSTDANSIPSGGTVINGVRFLWEISEQPGEGNWGGFTGISWFTDIKTGPTGYFNNGQFQEEVDVYNYLTQPGSPGNLNAVFDQWQSYLNYLVQNGGGWKAAYDSFYSKVPESCCLPF